VEHVLLRAVGNPGASNLGDSGCQQWPGRHGSGV
jgi:hypothetical protein